MKTFNFNIKQATGLLAGLLLSLSGYSQAHVTMSMNNITATENTIEYDLYIVNDGHTNFKLSACSYGINFNPGILNGGTLTYQYLDASRAEDLNGLTAFARKVSKVETVQQVRMTSTPCGYEKAPVLKPEQPFKVGRFSIRNSVAWTANSQAEFSFQEVLKIGLTTTQVVGYVDDSHLLTALTPGLQTVATEIGNTPVLNPSQTQQPVLLSSVQEDQTSRSNLTATAVNVRLYPNPTADQLHLAISLTGIQRITVNMHDMHGRLVKQIHAMVVDGLNELSFDVSELSSGMYTLQARCNDQSLYTGRFTKQ